MKELIKILQDDSGNKYTHARDLYAFLAPGTQFNHWIVRMFEYGFEDGIDFWSFLTESIGGRRATDYKLTLDCAKEISMIQRNEKGKQARLYFIEAEKQRNQAREFVSQLQTSLPSPKELAMMVIKAEEEKEALERRAFIAENSAFRNQAKADYVDTVLTSENTWTTTVIAKELGMSATTLNKRLQMLDVQYKTGDGVWVLKSKFQNRGYTTTRTHVFVDSSGNTMSNIITVWTEKGRAFIHWFLSNH